jgi:hypothetical protein
MINRSINTPPNYLNGVDHRRGGNQRSIFNLGHCTANEGPVRIKYKCVVPIHVFPKIKLLFPKQNFKVSSPSSYTRIYPGCRKIFGLILGKYKSLTDA